MWPTVTDWLAWSVCHDQEPCKNSWHDRDSIWAVESDGPKELCVRWRSRSPHAKWQFLGRKRRPIIKYRDSLLWVVQKWLNQSRCQSGCALRWVQGSTYQIVCRLAPISNHEWTIHARRRCGLLSNYIDQLLINHTVLYTQQISTYEHHISTWEWSTDRLLSEKRFSSWTRSRSVMISS